MPREWGRDLAFPADVVEQPAFGATAPVDVIIALTALPSVGRYATQSRAYRRPRASVTAAAANVLAILGSLSAVSFGYLVYLLFAPPY